jgi:hypothetical protein
MGAVSKSTVFHMFSTILGQYRANGRDFAVVCTQSRALASKAFCNVPQSANESRGAVFMVPAAKVA